LLYKSITNYYYCLLDTDAVLPINVTSPNSPREPRYIGDIRTPHLATPRRAKRALNLAKLIIKKQRRKILTLQQKTARMKNRVKTMKELIDHLKKKDFISENAVDHLMVYQEVSTGCPGARGTTLVGR